MTMINEGEGFARLGLEHMQSRPAQWLDLMSLPKVQMERGTYYLWVKECRREIQYYSNTLKEAQSRR